MKSKIFILLIALFTGMVSTQAQDQQKPKEGSKQAKKIAYITTRLELTPDEAEKFWPIYNEYQAEKKELRKTKKAGKSDKKVSEMSDKEVDELMTRSLDFQQKDLDLKKKYHNKYKSVLPVKKVAKFYHLEKEFKKQGHNKKKPGHHNGGGGGHQGGR